MKLPDNTPVPDLAGASALAFPALAVNDPAVRNFASLPFPVAMLGEGAPPAGATSHFAPPIVDGEGTPDRGSSASKEDGAPSFDPAMLDALAADPIARRQLDYLRAQAAEKLSTLTDHVCAMLAPEEKATSPSLPSSGPMNIRSLMAISRNGERSGRERRELAQGLVFGSVLNLDNPDWKPEDAAGKTPSEKNLLSALLQMEI